MAFYQGEPFSDSGVAIRAVAPEEVQRAPKSPDYADEISQWVELAKSDDGVLVFGIATESALVGQIFLHDQDSAGSSLVGYYLFEAGSRSKGIGTTALRLLKRHVTARTGLKRLVAITTDDNVASRRVAEKDGFVFVGPSREDPEHGIVLAWRF